MYVRLWFCVGLRQQYAVSLVFVLCRASSAVCCQLGVRPVSSFVSSMLSAWCSSCVGLRQQYAVSLLVFVLCRASSAVCCQPLSVRSVSCFVSSMLSVLAFVLCYAVSLSSAWALSANTMLYRIYSLLSNSVHLILIQLCSVQNALMGLDSEVDVLSETSCHS